MIRLVIAALTLGYLGWAIATEPDGRARPDEVAEISTTVEPEPLPIIGSTSASSFVGNTTNTWTTMTASSSGNSVTYSNTTVPTICPLGSTCTIIRSP